MRIPKDQVVKNMVITKEDLIQSISKENGIQPATVRSVLNALEGQVITSLSLTPPHEDNTIKIWNGLYIRCRYEEGQELNKGFFQNTKLAPRLRVKAETTRTFCNKINQRRKSNDSTS